MVSLADTLGARTREARFYERAPKGAVRCYACGHACPIPEGAVGVCKVRFNRGGRLYAPWGYVAGEHCDPIEKKPFFHAWPGALAYSFGMLGCDLHCSYCQNWLTSQALRDPAALVRPTDTTPEALVSQARRVGARVVVSTYNEPLITAEWAIDVFAAAREAGLATAFVSNGNGTARVIEELSRWVDLYKVDLKSFEDRQYRKLGGRLGPVLDTIRQLHGLGLWIEIVTLVVPGLNDSDRELTAIAEFVASVSPDVPWHLTAFHPDYKMADHADTSAGRLVSAARIGRDAGLRFVYAGNMAGRVGRLEDTRCPGCDRTLVARRGYHILDDELSGRGTCPGCQTLIPGRW